jgi:hypothetical protein
MRAKSREDPQFQLTDYNVFFFFFLTQKKQIIMFVLNRVKDNFSQKLQIIYIRISQKISGVVKVERFLETIQWYVSKYE